MFPVLRMTNPTISASSAKYKNKFISFKNNTVKMFKNVILCGIDIASVIHPLMNDSYTYQHNFMSIDMRFFDDKIGNRIELL